MELSAVGTVEEAFSFLQKNLDAHVVMSGLGQRRKIVKIKICSRDTNERICENWTQIDKTNMSKLWIRKSD